ncbi:ArsR family transcriptional regulator [Cryobacterium psychrophilum]|uniref:Transcriptional regulator n=1 Tax=Cryobacterium psychrophilum TaxID=41988 RepID=A0A4Y8KJS2_9MICO|nr:ArsR family transcriptional regulator [Cryobacterium psychrophilum]TFD75338.1 transcriptional regulator [Cryobacterium psychrophilum]
MSPHVLNLLTPTYVTPPTERERPPRLPEPTSDEIRLDKVFAVLSEPLRLTIVQRLLTSSDEFDHTCGWFGFDRPKSTLTHHFKALREAGVLTQRQYGLERRSRVRLADLNERFPGLVDLVLAWELAPTE